MLHALGVLSTPKVPVSFTDGAPCVAYDLTVSLMYTEGSRAIFMQHKIPQSPTVFASTLKLLAHGLLTCLGTI